MTSIEGGTFIAYTDCDEAFWLMHPDDGCDAEPVAWRLPDLQDPATLGCLLALVREAYPDAYTVPQFGGGWEVASPVDADVVGDGLSEAEALVAALERSP